MSENTNNGVNAIDKLATGIPGLNLVTSGGLPKARTTVVAGTAGNAKTVFGIQFLTEGIASGQNVVFVTPKT
jgi:circadian clock protein KaiC